MVLGRGILGWDVMRVVVWGGGGGGSGERKLGWQEVLLVGALAEQGLRWIWNGAKFWSQGVGFCPLPHTGAPTRFADDKILDPVLYLSYYKCCLGQKNA